MRILILEDNADRQVEMSAVLRDRFPYPIEFFSAAAPMLARIQDSGLEEVAAIILDHDLEMLRGGAGDWIDPGSGQDIVHFLKSLWPGPPVVIHTTNRAAGDSMEALLRESGWSVSRVVPYGDLEWIRETWFRTVRNAIVETVPIPLPTPATSAP